MTLGDHGATGDSGPNASRDASVTSKRLAGDSILMGIAAFLAVVATLGGPGITSDEPIDVRVGTNYLEQCDAAARLYGALPAGDARAEDASRLFADNAQHPPLGRLLLGISAALAGPFEGWLGGPDPFSVHAARPAPAIAYAVLVGVVGWTAGRRSGRVALFGTGLGMLLMPRVFAHAHFATLDTFLCLFWVLALLWAGRAPESRRPFVGMAFAGFVWGLALLTKIHAWLLPPAIMAWAFLRLPWRRALWSLAAWGVVGVTTFLVGWPWLWFDTWTRLRAYLETSVERLPLKVTYFGQVYLDRDVPWHYPWVYFAATVPLGLHAFGLLGLSDGWRRRGADWFPLWIAGTILMWLVVFSTNAPLYDGERLFLVVFPLWAILIGQGIAVAWRWCSRRRRRILVVILLLGQSYGTLSTHPFGLSYYNLLVGGLPGASRLGLELTYWGDTVDLVLLNDLASRVELGDVVSLAPTLHHMQAPAATTQALYDRGVVLREESAAATADWLVLYRREAYWTPEVRAWLQQATPVVVRSRQGVWLSGLWRRQSTVSQESN